MPWFEVKDELIQKQEAKAWNDKSLGYVYQLLGELQILNQNEEKAIESWNQINVESVLKSPDLLL